MKHARPLLAAAVLAALFCAAASANEGKIQSYDESTRRGVIVDAGGGTHAFEWPAPGAKLSAGDKVDYMVTRGMEDGSQRTVILTVNGVMPGAPKPSAEPIGTIKSYDAKSKAGVMTDPQGVDYPFHFGLGRTPLDLHAGDKVKYVNQSAFGTREVMIASVVHPPVLSKPAPRGHQTGKSRGP